MQRSPKSPRVIQSSIFLFRITVRLVDYADKVGRYEKMQACEESI